MGPPRAVDGRRGLLRREGSFSPLGQSCSAPAGWMAVEPQAPRGGPEKWVTGLCRGANSRRGRSSASLSARGHRLGAGGETSAALPGVRAAVSRPRQTPQRLGHKVTPGS